MANLLRCQIFILLLLRVSSWGGPNIVIRPASVSDLPLIQSCNLRTLPENYTPYFYETQLKTWPELCLVAEDTGIPGSVVGYTLGKVEQTQETRTGRQGHVTSISVLPEYRKLGIAKHMMKALHAQMANRRKVDTVMLHVRMSNQPALRLYQHHLGYRQIDISRGYYQDGENAYVMRAFLRKQASRSLNSISASEVMAPERVTEANK
mmetsp:Transcript_12913/g.19070  ORF Transcript_12913/g.19070 Transcript_12913/m.19070 type:complete len:207 (+) Transcript_12913:192-812(+)|eukprot:CAMPEP_0113940686 /NCGR_PEP_ID=MMETSP1339-20121228/6770_1 /TAXON_ID=94617 /ORGANISM="Fibrocapsa japonica" /LENGTH=206 /DNA_ID=CAMNT_0000944603 /DNA_START=190 /DNA_END=810 /DNA_ORIENTATION=+ /assembly_acc=CAM_ASM_000762